MGREYEKKTKVFVAPNGENWSGIIYLGKSRLRRPNQSGV
jgi:hypothetical protein